LAREGTRAEVGGSLTRTALPAEWSCWPLQGRVRRTRGSGCRRRKAAARARSSRARIVSARATNPRNSASSLQPW